jgi:hypothetical protein
MSGRVPIFLNSHGIHGRVSDGCYLFPCFSVDSVAIISIIIKLKKH